MGQYKSGTASFTNGSTTVSISGATDDASQVAVGQLVKRDLDGDAVYQIASRTPSSGPSLTSMTLSAPYGGATGSQSYQITRDYSIQRGYVLPAQGDVDAADWLAKAIAQIDFDLGALLGTAPMPTLTPGAVLFKGAAGVGLTQNASNFFWDNTNYRLGLGTTAPADRLDVNGNVRIEAGYALLLRNPLGNNFASINANNLSGPTSADLAFSTGNISNAIYIVSSTGNVGLGTTTPGTYQGIASRLDVSSASAHTLINANAATGFISGIDFSENGVSKWAILSYNTTSPPYNRLDIVAGTTVAISCASSGNVGLGTTAPGYQLTLSTDSAAKPSTSTWTVASDARLKTDIELADLARCYEIVKAIPLKRYTWKSAVYTNDQVSDRSKLGWIAQDVRAVFPKGVKASPLNLVPVVDGTEDVQVPMTKTKTITETSTTIEIVNGVPVQKTIPTTRIIDEPIVDHVAVVDEAGHPVLNADGTPLTHPVPRMQTVTKPKYRTEVIDDCLSLNADQLYAALYGAVQYLQQKMEAIITQGEKP